MEGQPFKLRVVVGQHEFEAEGDKESVERQFAEFRKLVADADIPPVSTPTPRASSPPVTRSRFAVPERQVESIRRLYGVDGELVFLHALPDPGIREPNRTVDALLLLILGHQIMRDVHEVGGKELLDGLKRSGVAAQRVDRLLEPHIGRSVERAGTRRGVKYRLLRPGFNFAAGMAYPLGQTVG